MAVPAAVMRTFTKSPLSVERLVVADLTGSGGGRQLAQ
jgi:hypothetical protein